MATHVRIAVVALLVLGACSSTTEDPTPPTDPAATHALRATSGAMITILHVNDTHSHLGSIGRRNQDAVASKGGLARAATVIAREKASDPGSVLLVHGGDLFQGTVYFPITGGVAELSALAALGLDAMTLGNHEFNLTPAVLLNALSEAFGPSDGSSDTAPPSPVVTANLDFGNESVAPLQPYVQRALVKEANGVRVGFFGMVTPDPAEQFDSQDPPPIDERFVEIATEQASSLRARADVVVLLSHLGFARDLDIAREVPGIDAIVSAHDHVLRAEVVTGKDGRRVPIVQAGAFYEWVGKLTFSVDESGVIFRGHEFIEIDQHVEPFTPFVEMLAGPGGLQELAGGAYGEELFQTPIAFVASPIEQVARAHQPQRDSPVANLITDALRAAGRSDVAITVNGLLTEGLPSGVLVGEDAFRIVGDGLDPEAPFASGPGSRLGAPLYQIRLPGEALKQALATVLARGGDYFPQVSGMSVVFDSRRPGAVQIHVGGEPLDPELTYTATVDVALLDGLTRFVPADAIEILDRLPCTEYEAVRDWLEQLRIVHYGSEGRIWDVSSQP